MSNSHENTLKILVVESDRIVARDVELTLDRSGFVVSGTPRLSSEVLDLVDGTSPDLILMSVEFESRMGGIKLAQILKEKYSLPIVFLTGRSEDQVFELARETRPAGYVRKPFSGSELIAAIEAAAQRIEPDKYLRDRMPAIRSVANSLDESVIVSGIDGRVVLMNKSAELLTGWQEEEASGSLYSQIAPTTHLMRDTPMNGTNGGCPCLVTDRKGRQHSVHAITTPVRDDKTELLGTITILKNHHEAEIEATNPTLTDPALSKEGKGIPGRARALQAFETIVKSRNDDDLESSLNDETLAHLPKPTPFQPLLDQIGDPMLVFDRAGIVTAANQEALAWFKSDQPLLGRPLWDLFTKEEVSRYEDQFLAPLQTGRRSHFEFHDTGRAAWNQIRLYRSHEGVIALFIDITELRLTRVEEVRQHRLEGLGLLARGFAHDFNNHLTTVTGNLGLVKKLEKDPELLGMLDEAEVASHRAAGLVQQLMTFATGGRPVREPVKVPELLRQVLADHRMGRPAIRYQFACSESDLKANLDRAQVRRVVENLVTNAEEAMPKGGTLSVVCQKITSKEAEKYHRDLVLTDEDYLLIEVVDSGVGMDQETLSRARDPYFSLRQDANATGIGLTVCESIAKAHDGFIHLASQPGRGTKAIFCVPMGRNLSHIHWEDLPRHPAPPTRKIPGETRDLNRALYRVLILEDDGPIRRLMGTALKRVGYQVIETAEGKETVSEYRKSQEENDPVDLVITDLTIENGMGGLETMRCLREMNPKIVAIVSSGYSDAVAMANPDAFGYKGVIPKPYSTDALADVVDRVILDHCASKSAK